MATILAQAGTSLYLVDPTTGSSSSISLPSGVTLSESRRPRFAAQNHWAVMVNSPSQNLAISPDGQAMLLNPTAPASAPTLAASGSGLNGSYYGAVTFVVKDAEGNDVTESKRSAVTNTVDLTDDGIAWSSIPTSSDTVPSGYTIHRRLYRTTSGGVLLYKLTDIEDNSTTTYADTTQDAALELLPAEPELMGDPPGALDDGEHMKVVVSWANRLWGVSDKSTACDTIRFTDDNSISRWTGSLFARPVGASEGGVIAMVPRRNQLLVLKRNGVWAITGTSEANFAIVQLVEGKGGCISADTVCIINDTAYWLAADGVYAYGPDGLVNLTDGDVAPWFKKDTVFNRTRFPQAFARYNEPRNQYELHLAAASASSENRWVSFNVVNRKWYGPHDTDAFTPQSAGLVRDENGLPISVVGGSDGRMYLANNETFTDGASSAIDFDCTTGWHHADNPNVEHHFGKLSVLSRVEADGDLTVIPTVGRTNSLPSAPMTHDLTKGREELERIGDGAMFKLRFRENTAGQGVSLYGYDVDGFENGKR